MKYATIVLISLAITAGLLYFAVREDSSFREECIKQGGVPIVGHSRVCIWTGAVIEVKP